jgi:predicted transcriptional regulator
MKTTDAGRSIGANGQDVMDWMDSWGEPEERPRPLLRGELR